MRLKLSLNGNKKYTAAIEGYGYIGTHLNIKHEREKELKSSVFISGHDTNHLPTVEHHEWPHEAVRIGDKVEIEVLDDAGESDSPIKSFSSSEDKYTLFENQSLANALKELVLDYEKKLFALLQNVQDSESQNEIKKFKRAMGMVLMANAENLLWPIYRKHHELIPDEMRNESF